MRSTETPKKRGVLTPEEAKALSEVEWSVERGIVFHSWRHFYASRLADNIELRKVQLATDHKSAVVAEVSAAHALDSDFTEVGAAVAETFGNMIPFRKIATNG